MLVKMKCYMEVGEVGTRNEDTHWRVEHMQFVGVGDTWDTGCGP